MQTSQKRHSRWYERLFFSTSVQILLTTLLGVLLPAYLLWDDGLLTDIARKNSIYGIVLCNIGILVSLRFLLKFPGNKSLGTVISTISFGYSLLFFTFFLTRIRYSIYLLAICGGLMLCYGILGYFCGRRWSVPKVALIPLGKATSLTNIPNVQWYELTSPSLPSHKRFDMLVTDLRSPLLTDTWQKFIAQCVLQGIPVYNALQVEESLTGRVKINHMYENDLGSLIPSYTYSFIKRCSDILIVLGTLPITLPIMFITAIVIALESKGGVLFTQSRVGKGGKEFTIYKFRSMTQDSEKEGAQFASQGDMRVTRVGKFIRKTRIDELPQFFNVLKGDMSLIGPRPEQKVFVEAFEQQIPFYNYRHIVRPGISGWAQVMQGYTADVEDTKVKVQYDFYYIKCFSLWLDILIIFKTIKTMLTGFGAR